MSDAFTDRAADVLRPPGALQRLDQVASHLAAWQRTDHPHVDRPAVIVFAADHGVAAAGVSAFPAAITAEMLAAVQAGKATINAFANIVGARVEVVDVGVGAPTADIQYAAALDRKRCDSTTRATTEET